MRSVARAISICVILTASPVAAQQWVDYVNPEYRFAVNFPVDPSEHDADYVSSSGVTLDRHISMNSAQRGFARS